MMKKIFLTLFVCVFSSISFAQNFTTIELGSPCPLTDYTMQSVDESTHTINQHFEEKGLVVIFTCNTCPFVVAWEDRYKMLEQICKDNNVDMLYVNSNFKKREGADSFLAMQEHAKNMGYKFPYLLDVKSQLANAFGAKTTPHIFLFNSEKELVYKGSIDDNYNSAKEVSYFYLNDAIVSMVNDKKIEVSSTKAIGCSIKRYQP
jgi:thioredoxin-related protein